MTIPRVEEMEEVAFVPSPFNKLGRFMDPSADCTLQAIESISKTIMAMKPLVVGRLPPQEGLANLSGKVAGVAMGIASVGESEGTLRMPKRYFAPNPRVQRRLGGKHTQQRPARIEGCE